MLLLEWTWEQWQWRSTPHSPKLQNYWNLTIRLLNVISRTLVVGGSYSSVEKQLVYSTAPADWATCLSNISSFMHLWVLQKCECLVHSLLSPTVLSSFVLWWVTTDTFLCAHILSFHENHFTLSILISKKPVELKWNFTISLIQRFLLTNLILTSRTISVTLLKPTDQNQALV